MDYTEKELTWILGQNPFEGDMDSNFRYLKNKMGKARKPTECRNCRATIRPGDTVRLMSVVFEDDGEILHGKYCHKCCDALAKDHTGEKFADRLDETPRPQREGKEGA